MYLTVAEFLDHYPMARSTFYKLVNDGHLAITKFGRSTRVKREHAEAWAASLLVRCGPPANDNDKA